MKIHEIIEEMRGHCGQVGRDVTDGEGSRDRILFGSPDEECTGVVVCIYPSIEVIRYAVEEGATFIVSHESLFWNHGDRTDWLGGNTAYRKKRALLESGGICVWRNHDHIHAGVEVGGEHLDGIFYGIGERMGWTREMKAVRDDMQQSFGISPCTAGELAAKLARTFGLNGIRFVGRPDCRISRVMFPMHVLGGVHDDALIEKVQEEDVNGLIAMEMVDFTVCEYVRDAAALGEDRCLFSIGHFNVEQLGMMWYAEYLSRILEGRVSVRAASIGDMYCHLDGFGGVASRGWAGCAPRDGH